MILYWTEEARQRLQDIRIYLTEDSRETANQTIAQIIERTGRLAAYPALGHKLNDYPNSNIRELLLRPYRIVYEITDNQILILSVLHYRQLIPKRFNKD